MSNPSPLAGEGQLPRSDSRVRGRRELLLDRAKNMRHEPTLAEKALWKMLRDRRLAKYKFRRQMRIDPHIVDFVCLERRVIIEADGGQHAGSESDLRREAFLRSQDFHILRFWNNEVLTNPAGVFDAIFAALANPHPPTAARRVPPSPARGERLGVDHG